MTEFGPRPHLELDLDNRRILVYSDEEYGARLRRGEKMSADYELQIDESDAKELERRLGYEQAHSTPWT